MEQFYRFQEEKALHETVQSMNAMHTLLFPISIYAIAPPCADLSAQQEGP